MQTIDWRRPLWLALLVAASIAFSLGFACAVPLAAFAAIAALTMTRGAALVLILAVITTNQCLGFTVLHYPRTPDAFAWGGAFVLVGVLAVLAGGWVKKRSVPLGPILTSAAVFLAAFAIYEGGLFLFTIGSNSDLYPYSAAAILRVFVINAVAFVGLLIASQLAASAGLATSPERSLPMPHRPLRRAL